MEDFAFSELGSYIAWKRTCSVPSSKSESLSRPQVPASLHWAHMRLTGPWQHGRSHVVVWQNRVQDSIPSKKQLSNGRIIAAIVLKGRIRKNPIFVCCPARARLTEIEQLFVVQPESSINLRKSGITRPGTVVFFSAVEPTSQRLRKSPGFPPC